jgi:hypothetical protein
MLNSVWRKAMLRSYDLDLVFVHTRMCLQSLDTR